MPGSLFLISSYVFSFYAIPPLTAGLLFLTLSFYVVIREQGSRVSIILGLLLISGAIWMLSYVGLYCSTYESQALWWAKIEHIGVVFIPSLMYLFALMVVHRYSQFRFFAWASLVCSCLFCYSIFATTNFIEGVYKYAWGFYPKYEHLSIIFMFFFLISMILSLLLLWEQFRHHPFIKDKNRFKWIFIAFCVAYFGSLDLFPAFGIPIWPVGFAPITLFLALLFYAIWKYRLESYAPISAYSQIFDSMQEAVLFVNAQAQIDIVNNGACGMLKCRKSDLVGADITNIIKTSLDIDIFPKDIKPDWKLRNLEIVMQDNEKNDIAVNLSASCIVDDENIPTGIVYVAIDITERKKAEKALKQTEERYKTIFENSAVSIMMADEKERVVSWNKFTEDMFGYQYNDLYLKPVESLYPKEEWAMIRSYNLRKMGMRHHLETKVFRKDANLIDIDISISVLKDENGAVTGSIGIIKDITEQKKAERELKKAKEQAEQASQTKSQFLANMSHEIRTPMNAVIGFTDLLSYTPLNDVQKDYVDTIKESGQTLLELINDILDISKVEAGEMHIEQINFDLGHLLSNVVKLIKPKLKDKPVELNLDLKNNHPLYFNGDPTRIRQIVLNLLSNAVKFTENGEITVALNLGEIKGGGKSREVSISVKDTGIGIPEEKHEAVFGAFVQADDSTTRKFGGTGLGLAITKSLVEKMGGAVKLISEQGKGSEFIITLNLIEASDDQHAEITPIKSKKFKGKKVLIVDDNEKSRHIMKTYCEQLKMIVNHVSISAQSAMGWIRSQKDLPDIIFIDIMMPDMDGFEFSQEIRADKRLKDIKLIAISSYAKPGSAREAQDAGFNAYLPKPIVREELIKIIQTVMGDKRPAGSIITRHIAGELAFKGAKALVCEDNSVNQKLISVLLKNLGCAADIAGNGQEGIEKLISGKYDIILMDIQMPVMGGEEAVRMIRKDIDKNIPIIALTAAAMHEDREKALNAGMNDYLAKPIDLEKLKNVLSKWLAKHEDDIDEY